MLFRDFWTVLRKPKAKRALFLLLNTLLDSQNFHRNVILIQFIFTTLVEENSRPLILQGELVWMVIILEKSPTSQLKINLKDKKIEPILPTLKFSINFSKYDVRPIIPSLDLQYRHIPIQKKLYL